jgi:anti-sigma regulatory factor (Ser/Thr protein kinase)
MMLRPPGPWRRGLVTVLLSILGGSVPYVWTHRNEYVVAPAPKRPRDAPSGFVDVGDRWFTGRSADGPPEAPRRRLRTHVVREVLVLKAAGRLGDVVEDLSHAIELALADLPRGVVCDLSAVLGDAQPDAVDLLAEVGRQARDWPGTPIAMACPDLQLRAELAAHPMGRHLIVSESIFGALSAVLRTPTPHVQRLRLAPHPNSARTSRDFVARTLLEWQLDTLAPSACLVISELVTNSTVHAGTEIDLSIAWDRRVVRLTVRDRGQGLPRERQAGLEPHGRGLTIVAGLARVFGVLPSADGGKVVWAVLDVPSPSPATIKVHPVGATADQEPPLLRPRHPVPATDSQRRPTRTSATEYPPPSTSQ